MLKIITGKNLTKVLNEANKKALDFLSKNPNSVVEKVNNQIFSINDLSYRANANVLFGGLSVYILDDFIKDNEDDFIKITKNIHDSKSLFIFCEEAIIKDIEKSCLESGGEVVKLLADEKVKDNPFAITDALIAKDKKKTWQLYRYEIDRGEPAEAILGRFAWAIKTLTLIQKNPTQSALDLGISPFVYSKTKSKVLAWTGNEALNFYTQLLFGMKKDEEIEVHLEKLILG
ncbi:hypothetical protein A3C57_01735 [Candidatus Nomurabacteria bacterium RIFCSPHIGHO2_02_FULL_33_12]|uniref:DNA polymerase III delta N-terminal domain-containing protein n=1 Tax=Candidatus Nomurabacteria bacterium RIFCSPLOWO2_01_FULL_33_17 TaxID=1801764 RepID=A0A1F6WN15_9BACT|nr:MAG: hypothetical protein A3C57_01735 [Candidatus Nomurabacteria bacterium RIFCSPHIGHO2_02_FULL_33_12]OGI83135.1 MAG: hypothetical protein A2903_01610 [Candidatus Nomurabacteria bacterium RIFCSPLOWO2_01_FULL_33_17]